LSNGVIWRSKGQKKETLDEFFRDIGQDSAREFFGFDVYMHDPYPASIREEATKKDEQLIKGTEYLLLKNEWNLKDHEKR
jgi:hypothetical protein